MKANIWAGLFSTDSLGGWGIPDYYCATGNCTWEGYSTLGVCSRCADITTKLNKTCNAHAADLNNATGCDVVLPNGFSLGGPDGQRNHLLAASADYEPMIYGNYSASLAVIHTIRADDLSTLFVNQSTSLSAYECVMIPCVINYDQSLVLSSDEFKKFGLNFIPFGETAGSIYDNFTLVNSASLGNAPTIQIPFNSSRGNPTTYQMSGPAYIGLQSYLQSMFNGFVTSNGNTSSFEGDNKTRAIKINAADVMQSLNIPTAYCYDIFNTLLADSVTCTMQTTAMAMTKIIRDFEFRTYNFSQYAMTGTTWSPKPMIDVAWLWIIPITALWSLCAILAFGTMWKARRVGAGGMVLDPLTLLFANVEGRNDPEGAAGPWWHSKEEAQKLAEQMQVRLTMDERKVSFVQRSVKVEE
jgi:hypothetical protein